MTTPAGGPILRERPRRSWRMGAGGSAAPPHPHGRAGAEREPEGGTAWTADYHTGSPSRSNPDVPKQEPTPEMGAWASKIRLGFSAEPLVARGSRSPRRRQLLRPR